MTKTGEVHLLDDGVVVLMMVVTTETPTLADFDRDMRAALAAHDDEHETDVLGAAIAETRFAVVWDTSPRQLAREAIAQAYAVLSKISPNFTVAAAFGNVHGVYKPGNVKLKPTILRDSQQHIEKTLGTEPQPVNFVFHGGSGSTREEIREALGYGVIKMNLDTDVQWSFWDGVRAYEAKNRDYLQGQLGNPKGHDAPNQKYYDPRVWLGAAEDAAAKRLLTSFEDLNCLNRNA